MSEKDTKVQICGCSGLTLLGIAFVVLKLCGAIDWSWWWVTAPFWIQAGLAILVFTVFAVFLLIEILIKTK